MKCRICNSEQSKFLFKIREKNDEIKFIKCDECGLVYTDLILSTIKLQETYSEQYFRENYHNVLSSKISFFKEILEFIESQTKKVGKLLDVGCGVGTFLEIAKTKKWDAIGVEISNSAIRNTQKKKNLEVYEGSIELLPRQYKDFDLITAWDVIEHVEDPVDFLLHINKILKKDGILVLKIPNSQSISVRFYMLLSRISNRDYIHATSHLSHFTASTISLTLEKAGFVVHKIQTAPEPTTTNHDISWKRILWKLLAGFLKCTDLFQGQRASLVIMAQRG